MIRVGSESRASLAISVDGTSHVHVRCHVSLWLDLCGLNIQGPTADSVTGDFMEKPVCVDAAGYRTVMETNELADMSRSVP